MEKSKLAQEIRINNLLQYKEEKDVAIVEFVSNKHFDCRTQSGFFTPNGEYEPIELTEEWLLKFGYVPNDPVFSDKSTFYTKGKHKIWYPFNQFLDECYRFEIKYVHQLQNLYFALTGEELTIKEQK